MSLIWMAIGAVAVVTAFLARDITLARREGAPFQRFVCLLEAEGVDREVAEAVHKYYVSFTVLGRIGLSPSDTRHDLFGSTDEDLLDDVRLILRRFGLDASETQLIELATGPSSSLDLHQPELVTIGDIAKFVNAAVLLLRNEE